MTGGVCVCVWVGECVINSSARQAGRQLSLVRSDETDRRERLTSRLHVNQRRRRRAATSTDDQSH